VPDPSSPHPRPSAAPSEAAEPGTGADAPKTVEAILTSIRTTVDAQHQDLLDALRSGVLEEIQATAAETARRLNAAQEARAEQLDALRDEDRDGAVPTDAGDIVQEYRETVVQAVLTPLREKLRFVDTGVVLRSARQGLAEDRSSLAAQQPDTVSRPEPEALFAADADDGFVRRTRKAWTRTTRRLQSWITSPPARSQAVPIARLVRFHLYRRLPEAEEGVMREMEQRLAGWTARLERAATEWAHASLRAEASFDPLEAPEPREPHPDLDAEAEAGPEEEIDRQLHRLETAEQALLDVLESAEQLSQETGAARLQTAADRAHAALEEDAFTAGSFMSEHRPLLTPPDDVPGRWVDWYRQVTAHLAIVCHLSDIRDRIHTEQESLAGAVVDAGVAPARQIIRDTLRRLQAFREDVDSLLDVPPPGTERHLVQSLDDILEQILEMLDTDLAGALRQTTVRRDTEAVVQTRIDTVRAAIEAQPESFVIHALPSDPEAPISPEAPSHTVQWRTILGETTSVLLFDAWRALLPPIAKTVTDSTETADEVIGIVRFNVGAATEELQDLLVARRREESTDELDQTHLDAARELALDGLDRAMALLSEGERPLTDAGVPVVRAVRSTTTTAWARIHERVRAAGQAREQVLRARALTESYLRSATEWSQATGRELRIRLQRTLQLGRRRAERIVRMGQSAVGTGEVDDAVVRETVEAVVGLEDELSEMPLVYRRLFSLRPVRDPDLLVGRDADIQRVDQHVQQWNDGLPNALILTADPGSGMTSLLNVLSATTLRRARRYTVDLNERYRDEAEVARIFGRVLGLTRNGDAASLDELAARIRSQPPGQRHRVVFVEHLEHLFLRAVHGTRLLGRVLEFMSATDSHVIWIGTMSGFGWQILQAHEPEAGRLAVQHTLTPVNRETLEDLIIRRHRRSGLGLTFEAPEESAQPLLTRRLARAETDEDRQAILRAEYFDRLHSLCGQNVMLALFHWFRSVQLDAEGTGVSVAPVRPIRFDFLETFSLRQSFTLKAFLEHASLTVGELSDVLQISEAEARTVMESIGNAQLIAPAETIGVPGTFAFDGVEPGVRYRVRPMVLHPVARHLRSRNIVH